MAIKLIVVGKTSTPYLVEGEKEYLKRLGKYTRLTYIELPNFKQATKWTPEQLKKEEGKLILSKLKSTDWVILLDERGKEFNSVGFAKELEKITAHQASVVFVIGGAFGFSDELYKRASQKLAISQMTLSHRMIRLFFLEQLYRAYTILRGESYHH